MKVKLIGSLDYGKLRDYLEIKGKNGEEIEEIIEYVKKLTTERNAEIVSAAGRLSRFPGTVSEILELAEENTYEKNVKFINRVCGMGHDSITDHAYYVFGIEDITPVIEQIIIEERFSSFTVKSRREVDFSKSGSFTPTFRDKDYRIMKGNDSLREQYNAHASMLFHTYEEFVAQRLPLEDARYILPYSFYSNLIMGVDAHTLKDMIIKFTKTKYAKISELREFGMRLYDIAKKHVGFIIGEIDKTPVNLTDGADDYLEGIIERKSYKIIDKPKLISRTNYIDDTILISSIMRRYQYSFEEASRIYNKACAENPNFKVELMRKIAFESDRKELAQVNFEFQIPLSYAVLTHLTRHRTHPIMTPDFITADLTQFKTPTLVKNNIEMLKKFREVFAANQEMYESFKRLGICDEDLIYFVLSGNMTNIVTNLDGKTTAHILGLRECTKAQWETREMANGIHEEIESLPDASIYCGILGPTCVTQGFCKEGKESCGRILTLQEKR